MTHVRTSTGLRALGPLYPFPTSSQIPFHGIRLGDIKGEKKRRGMTQSRIEGEIGEKKSGEG